MCKRIAKIQNFADQLDRSVLRLRVSMVCTLVGVWPLDTAAHSE